jgi:hypothetical protein
MTGRALNSLTNVGGVIKSNVRFVNPAPHTLPGYVLFLVVISFQLVDFCTIFQRRRVTVPAGSNIGDRSHRPSLDRDVAIHACELNLANMDVVGKCDGLLCAGLISKKM